MKDLSAPSPLGTSRAKLSWKRTLLLFSYVALGCTPRSPEPVELPADPPYIRGMLTRSDSAMILVEENPSDSLSLKTELRFGPNTAILWRTGDPASRDDLRLGAHVSAWVVGPVLQSYPSRATLGTLVIESTTQPGTPGI